MTDYNAWFVVDDSSGSLYLLIPQCLLDVFLLILAHVHTSVFFVQLYPCFLAYVEE